MRKILTSIVVLLPLILKAQLNMVHNGSFEQYSSCPTDWDQLKKAVFWQNIDTVSLDPICSPEYCNSCAGTSGSYVTVPQGSDYNHYPRSGNGFVEMVVYFDIADTFDPYPLNYTQGKLFTNLNSGTTYCVTFYVTLTQGSQFAVNHIGAYLDNGSIDSGQDSVGCGRPQIAFVPQIVGAAIINDTLNWVKIQGSFVANGSEKFITIGNFFDVDHTDTIRVHPHFPVPVSFYLLDDVSVIESTATANAGGDTAAGVGDTVHIGIHEDGLPTTWYALGDTTPIGYGGDLVVHPTATGTYKYVVMLDLCGHVTYDTMTLTVWPQEVKRLIRQQGNQVIWPNPSSGLLTIEHAEGCEVTICDVVGKEMRRWNAVSDKEAVDISALQKGVYFVRVMDASSGYSKVLKLLRE